MSENSMLQSNRGNVVKEELLQRLSSPDIVG